MAVNKQWLRAELVRNGYTYKTISKKLSIGENTFAKKMIGLHEFTLSEMQKLIEILDLDDQKVKEIFLVRS